MSRSGYSDDLDNWSYIKWAGWVASAKRGKRGQAFFKELIDAMDAMPEKRLVNGSLRCTDGVCALGALGTKREMDLEALDPEDWEAVGKAFGIAGPLAAEIVYQNDERILGDETPEQRWVRMREWARSQLREQTHQERAE